MSERNGMELAIEESLLSLTERIRRQQQDETDHITAIRVSQAHDFTEVDGVPWVCIDCGIPLEPGTPPICEECVDS